MQTNCPITAEEIERLRDPKTRNEVFDRLADQLLHPLYGYARRLVVDHDDAEDVVQEALVKAYDKIAGFRGGGHHELTAWIYRITTHVAINHLRRRKRSLFSSLDEVGRELAAEVADNSREDADEVLIRLQQAILQLPIKQRLVFNLRYYDGLAYSQIAEVLGQSESSLKTNYHYAVEKLKKQIQQEL